MAPDDLKFERMEARLREQQLIMAELGQVGANGQQADFDDDYDYDEAIANLKHKRADSMVAMVGGVVAATVDSGGGGTHGKRHGSLEAAAAPFAAARQCQKYGACEPASRTKLTHLDNNNNKTSNFKMDSEVKDDDQVLEKESAPDESRLAGATIGGSTFVEVANTKEDPYEDSSFMDIGATLDKKKQESLDCERGIKDNQKDNNNNNNSSDDKENHEEPQRPCIIKRLAKVIPCFGILLSLGASVFLGTAGMLVKLVESVHGIEVAVFRALIQLVIYASLIGIRQRKWRPDKGEVIPVAMRAILGGSSITFSYYALKLIPLGDATTIRFSLPIWTMIMSYFFLNESCNSFKVVAVFISISGVVLVTKPDDCIYALQWLAEVIFQQDTPVDRFASLESSNGSGPPLQPVAEDVALHNIEEITMLVEAAAPPRPPPLWPAASWGRSTALPAGNLSGFHFAGNNNDNSNNNNNTLNLSDDAADGQQLMVVQAAVYSDPLRQVEGCLMALASSICLAISIIALRMCKQTPSEVSIFWLSASSVLVGSLTLIMLDEWSMPDNVRDCLYILLNGLCGSLGQWFMTNALKVEQSGLIALARTFDIEVAFLYSALLLGEIIRTTSIIGSVLVSLGVITVLVPRLFGGCGQRPADEGRNGEEEGADRGGRGHNLGSRTSDAHEPAPSSAASSSGTTDEGDQHSRQTVTTVLNVLALDATRRSVTPDETAGRPSLECLGRSLEAGAPKSAPASGQVAVSVGHSLPGQALV